MATDIYRLDPDRTLPFGWTADYFTKRRFSLPTGHHCITTPFMAHSEQDMIDRGMSGLMTIGSGNLHLASQNRSVFIDGSFLEGYARGLNPDNPKPLSQFSREDCINAVRGYWNSLGRPGWVTSGAQEGRHVAGGDQWAQIYSQVPNQYRWVTEGWGQIMAEYSWFHYLGGYDGCGPSLQDEQAVRDALSSDAAALAFMKVHERGEHPYFKEELWRWQDISFNQYYRSATDNVVRYYELVVCLEIMRRALRAVGAENRLIVVFTFPVYSEFVNYEGEGYTAQFKYDVPAGGYWEGWSFPSYSPGMQSEFVHCALDGGNSYHGWGDSRYFGRSPNIVSPKSIRESDGFKFGFYHGTAAVEGKNDPRPFVAGSPYGFPVRPVGMEDMIPTSAEFYAIETAWIGSTTSRWLRHSPAGANNYTTVLPTYPLDRKSDKKGWVRGGEVGNKAWIKVVDMDMEMTGPRGIDVILPSGRTVSLTGKFAIEAQVPNHYLIEFKEDNA